MEYFDLPSFPPQAKETDSFQELYFDFLPIEKRENIVSCGEGMVAIERWTHLEKAAAKELGVACEVYVCRNDLNQGSGTFKDISAALAASVLKEQGVKEYCLVDAFEPGMSFFCGIIMVINQMINDLQFFSFR